MADLERLFKVVDPDPVLVDQASCLRVRHRGSPCRRCEAVCPAGAIGFAEGKLAVDAGACTRCGLCAGACPTAALQVRGLDETALDRATRLRCSRAAGDGLEVPCLGWLTADHLIHLGLRLPGLELAAGECSTCPLAAGGAQAQAALSAAAGVLAALRVQPAPRWVTRPRGAPEAPQQRPVSRRDFFRLWRRDLAQTGRSLMPEREVNPIKLPARVPRRRLRWLAAAPNPAPNPAPHPAQDHEVTGWPTRAVAGECNGCEICVAFCPTGALTSTTENEIWRLSHQPAACVDCGTCLHLCPRRVLVPGQPAGLQELLAGGRRELAALAAADRHQARGYRPRR